MCSDGNKTGKNCELAELIQKTVESNMKIDQLTAEVRGLKKQVSLMSNALKSKTKRPSSTATQPQVQDNATPSSPFATSLKSLISQISSKIPAVSALSHPPLASQLMSEYSSVSFSFHSRSEKSHHRDSSLRPLIKRSFSDRYSTGESQKRARK